MPLLIIVLIIIILMLTIFSEDILAVMKKTSNVVSSGVTKEIVFAIGVADEIYRRIANQEVVITSLNDSQHMAGSLHYLGQAVDFRTRTLTLNQLNQIVAELKNRLYPLGYDVVLESDHIHIEYDPKGGRKFTL